MLMAFGFAQLAAGSCCGGKASKPLDALVVEMTTEDSDPAPASTANEGSSNASVLIKRLTKDRATLPVAGEEMFHELIVHFRAVLVRDTTTSLSLRKEIQTWLTESRMNLKKKYPMFRGTFQELTWKEIDQLAFRKMNDPANTLAMKRLGKKDAAMIEKLSSQYQVQSRSVMDVVADNEGTAYALFGCAPSLTACGLGWNSYWAMSIAALFGAVLVLLGMVCVSIHTNLRCCLCRNK